MHVLQKKYARLKFHDYIRPAIINDSILGDNIFLDIIYSRAFKRLHEISFLGAIDYTIVPRQSKTRQRYSRFQHSVGVAQLADYYARIVELEYSRRQEICVAGLLHDLGHAPLSHSLEGLFQSEFNINHHLITENLITGRISLGKEIYDILKWKGIKVDNILSILNGQHDNVNKFFSGPINFDTIEGIMRSFTYARNTTDTVLPSRIVRASVCRDIKESESIIDDFWKYKDFLYTKLINSSKGILSDEISKYIMRESIHLFSPEDFLITEPELFKKIPALKMILNSKDFEQLAWQIIGSPIKFIERRFYIDGSVDFRSMNDHFRYKQTKHPSIIVFPETQNSPTERHIGAFFDDEPV